MPSICPLYVPLFSTSPHAICPFVSPQASQGAVLKESKSVSPDSSSHVSLNGIQTDAVLCGTYFILPMPFVVSCRQTIQDFVTNFISGVAPGAARANGARSSVRFSKASSESTRKHGGHQRRPSPKKQPGTPNRQWAGQTELSLKLPITLRPPGGMHRQPPPPPSKNNRGILLRHGRPERPGHRTRPGNRRTLYQVYDKPVHPLFCNFWSYGYHCRYRILKHTIFTIDERSFDPGLLGQ